MKDRGQHLTEAAIVIGIVGLALFAMRVYVTRGLQSRIKDMTDHMIGAEQAAFQQDTSGLEINESESSLVLDSVSRLREDTGGIRITDSREDTTQEYSSEYDSSSGIQPTDN